MEYAVFTILSLEKSENGCKKVATRDFLLC